MKKFAFLSIFIMLITLETGYSRQINNQKAGTNDTASYVKLSGNIIDQNTKAPVVFASVFKTGTSIGTVTNTDGEFVLKVPGNLSEGTISVSYLGYKNKEVSIQSLLSGNTTISLEQFAITLDEVVIRSVDPVTLLNEALEKKRQNYKLTPEMQKGFYRETIKQNRSYVSISEAVLDIYNCGYRERFDYDRVKIFKGRRSKDVKKMDTVLVKFQGGPRTSLFLDIVKNPTVLLDPEVFENYSYKLAGIVSIDNRNSYVIEFEQKVPVDYTLYSGKFYIDVESTAIRGIEFKISEMSLPLAKQTLVKKKPAGMDIDVLSANYLVNYRIIDGQWFLNYVRSEVNFKTKWDKKLLKSTISTMFEMAITDRDPSSIEKFPAKETAKFDDVFAEQVIAFEDDEFWGEYNYIKPDESIEVAIEKLNKKLKR